MEENFWECAECGKKFYNTAIEQYIYKKYKPGRGIAYFCGWNCMRKYEKKRAEARKNRK